MIFNTFIEFLLFYQIIYAVRLFSLQNLIFSFFIAKNKAIEMKFDPQKKIPRQ
jgi:hypothetical protein